MTFLQLLPLVAGGKETNNVCIKLYGIAAVTIQTGINTAGDNFTLECSLSGTNDTDDVVFQWFNDRTILSANNISSDITVSTSGHAQQLHFTPLQQQHEGVYTCTVATVNGATESKSTIVTVNGIQFA